LTVRSPHLPYEFTGSPSFEVFLAFCGFFPKGLFYDVPEANQKFPSDHLLNYFRYLTFLTVFFDLSCKNHEMRFSDPPTPPPMPMVSRTAPPSYRISPFFEAFSSKEFVLSHLTPCHSRCFIAFFSLLLYRDSPSKRFFFPPTPGTLSAKCEGSRFFPLSFSGQLFSVTIATLTKVFFSVSQF